MRRGSFGGKLTESFKELGKETAKSTGEALKSFSPLKIMEQMINPQGTETAGKQAGPEGQEQAGKMGSTPLNLEKLGKTYQKNDQAEAARIQQRLFNMVNSGTEQAISSRKYQDQERTQMAADEQRAAMQKVSVPEELNTGSARKKGMSGKKAVQNKQAEYKPSGTK